MTDQSENTCASCLFWENVPERDFGVCRRSRPYLTAVGNGSEGSSTNAAGLWPATNHYDWCGEHRKRRS